MPKKVRWGVLGAANIAVRKVIPATQRGRWSEVTAVASRDVEKARRAAEQSGIPKVYGSYEELLADAEEHRETRTDVLTSAMLDFPAGHSVFTCSTRVTPHQRVQIVGTRGRIEVLVPANSAPERPSRVLVDDGSDLYGGGVETLEFAPADQYTIQGDLFSRCVRKGGEPPAPPEESVRNMAVVEAIFRSARTGAWESPAGPRPVRAAQS